MDRTAFAAHLTPAAEYYGKKLTDSVLEFYFGELGNVTEKRLDQALRTHMANSPHWPKVSEIRQRLGMELDDGKRRARAPASDAADHMHHAMRMLEARFTGDVYMHSFNSRFPLEPLVEDALKDYDRAEPPEHLSEWGRENCKRSFAFGRLNQLVARSLEA